MTTKGKSDLIQVTGSRPRSKTSIAIKTTLLHEREQAAFLKLKANPVMRFNATSEASMALVLRRALTLYTRHLDSMDGDLGKTIEERECLIRLSLSGTAYKLLFQGSER
jgi:hypothetical protein